MPYVPTCEEWTQYQGGSGPDGGCEATVVQDGKLRMEEGREGEEEGCEHDEGRETNDEQSEEQNMQDRGQREGEDFILVPGEGRGNTDITRAALPRSLRESNPQDDSTVEHIRLMLTREETGNEGMLEGRENVQEETREEGERGGEQLKMKER